MGSDILKKILVDEGLTQSQLSAVTKVSAGTINKVACGRRTPSPRIQSLLLKGLQELCGKVYKREALFPGKKK